jgi:hypothetical protein
MLDNFSPGTRKGFGYLLSLPERGIRSLAAVAGGATLLLTETLLPEPVLDSTLFRVTIGDLQQFLIERVAGMEGTALRGMPRRQLEGDYFPRKMAGSVIETAGLFWYRFSPIWVFAIAGDAAAGSQVFLQRLVAQLKANNVLPEEAEPTSLAELLSAVETASRSSADAVNLPPLSEAELRQTAVTLRDNYGRLFANTKDLLPRFESLWNRMETVAEEQDASTAKVGGVMSLDLAGWGQKGAGSVAAFGQTSGELLDEYILESYAKTLDGIAAEGLPRYMSSRIMPFLETAVRHLQPAQSTWTESNLV